MLSYLAAYNPNNREAKTRPDWTTRLSVTITNFPTTVSLAANLEIPTVDASITMTIVRDTFEKDNKKIWEVARQIAYLAKGAT